MIVPLALLSDQSASGIRRLLIQEHGIEDVQAFPQKDDENNRVFEQAKLATAIFVVIKDGTTEHLKITVHPGRYIDQASPITEISVSDVEKFDKDYLMIPIGDPKETIILQKMFADSRIVAFNNMVNVLVGEIDMTSDRDCVASDVTDYELLKGAHLQRYWQREEPKQGEREWIAINKVVSKYGNNSKALLPIQKRIGFQAITGTDDSRRLKATEIPSGFFLANSVNYFEVHNNSFHTYFILALINSQFIEWRFRLTSTNNNVNNYEILTLPAPSVGFTTPSVHRQKSAEKGCKLYVRCLFEGDGYLLEFVEHHLSTRL